VKLSFFQMLLSVVHTYFRASLALHVPSRSASSASWQLQWIFPIKFVIFPGLGLGPGPRPHPINLLQNLASQHVVTQIKHSGNCAVLHCWQVWNYTATTLFLITFSPCAVDIVKCLWSSFFIYDTLILTILHYITLLHLFNGFFSRTTWVSQYQKGKTSLNLN